MDKLPVEKYFARLRFVFLASFVSCVSLYFLVYLTVNVGQRGVVISSILFHSTSSTDLRHAQMPKPSSFSDSSNYSETITPSPVNLNTMVSNFTNPNNGTTGASNIQNITTVLENHVEETIVPANATHGEGNRIKQMKSSPPVIQDNGEPVTEPPKKILGLCSGQYIYVYDVPSRFNKDLLKDCHSLWRWTDMCPYMSNLGLGPKITEKANKRGKVLLKDSWYATNQFSLEVIFHNMMKQYKCLTNDSSLASAVYVPYYAGLDVGQYLWGFNASVRDANPKELVKWLEQQLEWKKMWGRDHFMVGGRICWDFRRSTDSDSEWGTKLMFLPGASNMSFLTIESCPYDNDISIPYPTYFHPSKDVEVFKWQKIMRRVKRPYLFSFVGAPRPDSSDSFRSDLIKHCRSSKSCKLLACYVDSKNKNYCDNPVNVIRVFQSSVFCLQPPGDSYTRRSTFDSILAGCIPVFFHPSSAYEQYLWHFPKNGSRYSVFIPEADVKEKGVMINETLSRVPKSEILAMREEVISIIPRIIYRHPSSRLMTVEDAFDIAVKGILGRIERIRRELIKVNDSYSL